MDIRYDHRALANRGCNPFHRFGSHIADSIDTGNARRVGCGFKSRLTTGENKSFVIELDGAVHPTGVWLRANHDKDTGDWPSHGFASFPIRPRDEFKSRLTFKLVDFRIRVESDLRRTFDSRN